MPSQLWFQPLVTAQADTPTAITTTTPASCLPSQAVYQLPGSFFKSVGDVLLIRASGIISCAASTPGTARFDVRIGGTVVFDGLAVPLNTVGKSGVGWLLEIELTARVVGAAAQLLGHGTFLSEAGIGAPLSSVAGAGAFNLPYATAPTLGNSFDSTVAAKLDLFFTQTVGTGSLTLKQYLAMG